MLHYTEKKWDNIEFRNVHPDAIGQCVNSQRSGDFRKFLDKEDLNKTN